MTNHRDYEAFGELLSETNSAVDLLFGFTGRALDESTGKQYNTTRWYMPDQGEWMSEDWIGFLAQDSNIRRYVENDPVSFVDPDGFWGGTIKQKAEEAGDTIAEISTTRMPRPVPRSAGPYATSGPYMGDIDAYRRGDPDYTTTFGEEAVEWYLLGLDLILTFTPLGTCDDAVRGARTLNSSGDEAIDLIREARSLAKNPTKAGKPRGGIGPVLKGKRGVELSEQEAIKAGETVRGREVTFELPSGKRTKSDLVTDTPVGDLKVREAKHGPTACLSPGQKEMKDAAMKGRPVIPRGRNAKDAGLEPGKPRRIDIFEEDRF